MHNKLIFENKIIEVTPNMFDKNVVGQITLLTSAAFDIDIIKLHQKEVYTSPVCRNEDHIEIHFELQGDLYYTSKNEKNLQTNSGNFSFFYEPEIEGEISFIPNQQKRNSIGIEFTKDYLSTFLEEDSKTLDNFWDSILKKRSDSLITNTPIDTRLYYLLNQLSNSEYTGHLHSIYLQAKVNEILVYILNSHKVQNLNKSITSNEKDQLYYACQLIKNNLTNPYSLENLAISIGMSKSKLSSTFKSFFGISVFQFLLQQRMCKAKELLLDTDLNIADVSYMVGYKNPTHFTHAFKNFYNYLPSKINTKK